MNELLEYIRFAAKMEYNEEELKAKPLFEFYEIAERARKRVDAMQKATKGKSK